MTSPKPDPELEPAAVPFGASKTTKAKNPFFVKANTKNFGIGALSCRHLSHSILEIQLEAQARTSDPKLISPVSSKWLECVRLQRQRVILHQRLKLPPAIAQFSHTLDKNTATQSFKLLNKYRPESKQEKKARFTATPASPAEEKEKEKDVKVRSFPSLISSSLT